MAIKKYKSQGKQPKTHFVLPPRRTTFMFDTQLSTYKSMTDFELLQQDKLNDFPGKRNLIRTISCADEVFQLKLRQQLVESLKVIESRY